MNSKREKGIIIQLSILPLTQSTEVWVVGWGMFWLVGFSEKNKVNNALLRFCLIR